MSITCVRDPQPPFANATGIWWKWTASVVTPLGTKIVCTGWTPKSERQAGIAAKASERRLKHVHCRRLRWTQNNGLQYKDGARNTETFVISPKTVKLRERGPVKRSASA